MLKVQVEGEMRKVEPFVRELARRPHVEVASEEVRVIREMEPDMVRVRFRLQHQPQRRVKVVSLFDGNGREIRIPLMDVISVRMDDGRHIVTGRSFDIFA
ncbi:hypothetical protein [Staphylospora marina]|uniref:hypothetical protein n=1 Tax=Staphylospora marina TaxID=2490858 RepID=UPI000F5C0288|nr:hypothetical protein [Staphylospora marina]